MELALEAPQPLKNISVAKIAIDKRGNNQTTRCFVFNSGFIYFIERTEEKFFGAFENEDSRTVKKIPICRKKINGNKIEEFPVLMNMTAPPRNNLVANTNRLEFEKTVLPHFDAAYNLARWLTRNTADADDVVQEAYMRAFKFFGGFNGGDCRSWMLRIVRNTCYSWLQKNRSSELVYELSEALYDDKNSGPEVELIENVERQWLRQKIEELPAPFREVIVLRDIEGMSYKEIASVTESPVGTVMSRLARGRERLQKQAGVDEAGGKR